MITLKLFYRLCIVVVIESKKNQLIKELTMRIDMIHLPFFA